MDPLSVILQRFSMNTEVFFTGHLCGISNFNREPNKGHLHLLQSGEITIIDEQGTSHLINEPTVMFFPTQHAHRVIASEENPPKNISDIIDKIRNVIQYDGWINFNNKNIVKT